MYRGSTTPFITSWGPSSRFLIVYIRTYTYTHTHLHIIYIWYLYVYKDIYIYMNIKLELERVFTVPSEWDTRISKQLSSLWFSTSSPDGWSIGRFKLTILNLLQWKGPVTKSAYSKLSKSWGDTSAWTNRRTSDSWGITCKYKPFHGK